MNKFLKLQGLKTQENIMDVMKKTILFAFLLLTLSCGNSDSSGSILDLEKSVMDFFCDVADQ